ncbi:MAG: hypothetical protein ABIH21_05615 [Patescibacteria group bacterium]
MCGVFGRFFLICALGSLGLGSGNPEPEGKNAKTAKTSHDESADRISTTYPQHPGALVYGIAPEGQSRSGVSSDDEGDAWVEVRSRSTFYVYDDGKEKDCDKAQQHQEQKVTGLKLNDDPAKLGDEMKTSGHNETRVSLTLAELNIETLTRPEKPTAPASSLPAPTVDPRSAEDAMNG